MNLIIKNPNDFKIIDGKLKSEKKFEVKKEDNDLIIFNKGIIFNGVSIDGITINSGSIKINNNEIIINGLKINDSMINKENEYLEYPLEKESINAISISSSARLTIDDLSILSDEDLSIDLQGSGTFTTNSNGYFIKSLNCSIQGSGDIQLNKFQANSCNCSVKGSGNIILKNSNFNNLNLNVMGSGVINGKNTTVEKISKNVMGSGVINGF